MKYDKWREPDSLNACMKRSQSSAPQLYALAHRLEKTGVVLFYIFCAIAIIFLVLFFIWLSDYGWDDYDTTMAFIITISSVAAAFVSRYSTWLSALQIRAKADIVKHTEIMMNIAYYTAKKAE